MKLKTTIYRQSGEFIQNDNLENVNTIEDIKNIVVEQNKGDVVIYQNEQVLVIKQKNTVIKYERVGD